MSERLSLFRPRFNRSIQIVSRPAEVSSDAGVRAETLFPTMNLFNATGTVSTKSR